MKFIFTLILATLSITHVAYGSFDHSHQSWDKILKKFTKIDQKYNRFHYSGLKKELNSLINYTDSLSNVSLKEYKSFTKNQQLAFLINAYNAFTIKAITQNYPIKSILRLGAFGKGPWDKKNITLLSQKLSLNMIEKDYMIPQFKEARIHFAINCASIGCPSLQNYAFTAKKLESQLEKSTKSFITNRTRYSYSSKKHKLTISKIFDWYKNDFINQYGSVQNLYFKYLKDSTIKSAHINYKHYDWNLNK